MESTLKKYHDWRSYIEVNVIHAFYVCAPGLDSLLKKLTDFQLDLKILVDFISLPI